MKKITREEHSEISSKSVDYIDKHNNVKLRGRYCYEMGDGKFVCVESNCNGRFLEGRITTFSGGHYWVLGA